MYAPKIVPFRMSGNGELPRIDVYIGSTNLKNGYLWTAGPWSNPFEVSGAPSKPEDRLRVLAAYERRVRADPALMAALPELHGKRLGCGCCHNICHGQILIKLLRETVAARAAIPDIGLTIPMWDADPVWLDLGWPSLADGSPGSMVAA